MYQSAYTAEDMDLHGWPNHISAKSREWLKEHLRKQPKDTTITDLTDSWVELKDCPDDLQVSSFKAASYITVTALRELGNLELLEKNP